jgi:hypothetical protein
MASSAATCQPIRLLKLSRAPRAFSHCRVRHQSAQKVMINGACGTIGWRERSSYSACLFAAARVGIIDTLFRLPLE